MAVLTPITEDDARALLAAYGLGELRGLQGIPAGSVNSNYAVDVVRPGSSPPQIGRVFLRIYEEQDWAGALRETALLERLARAGVPTPAPLVRLDGQRASRVRGKAAALFPWQDGEIRCQAGVTREDARLVGEALARIHVAGASEPPVPGRFGPADLVVRLDGIAASGDSLFAPLVPTLREALAAADAARDRTLPQGLMHGDLFRDNVLWGADGRLAALLDFESACDDCYAYDLMVAILSWCVGEDLDAALATAMRAGYESVRPLGEPELEGLWAEGCFAAMRFTITRITDYAMRTGATGPRVVKDWRRFKMRHDRLRALGPGGLRLALGA